MLTQVLEELLTSGSWSAAERQELRADAERLHGDFTRAVTTTERDLRATDDLLTELEGKSTGDYLAAELVRQRLAMGVTELRDSFQSGAGRLTELRRFLDQAMAGLAD